MQQVFLLCSNGDFPYVYYLNNESAPIYKDFATHCPSKRMIKKLKSLNNGHLFSSIIKNVFNEKNKDIQKILSLIKQLDKLVLYRRDVLLEGPCANL